MKILGTTRQSFSSRLIRHVTGESISHVAVEHGGWVMHSNFWRGVHVQTEETFRQENQVLYEIPVTVPGNLVKKRYARIEFKSYDKRLFAALALRAAVPWFVPKVDLWNASGMFICTELVHELVPTLDKLLTPEKLILDIRRKHHG